MSNLPFELINLIMSYMPPSPIVSIFKKDWIVIDAIRDIKSVKEHMDKNKFVNRIYNNPIDEVSFALSFFLNRYICDSYLKKSKYRELDINIYFSNSQVYNYSNMDSDYVDTLNEYHKNH